MTQHEYHEIAHYVTRNFISPLCFEKRTPEEIFLEYSSTKFNNFIQFLIDLGVEEGEKKNASEKH